MIIISIGTFSYTNSIFYNVVEGLLHYCEWNLCNTEKSIYNVCKTLNPHFLILRQGQFGHYGEIRAPQTGKF